MPTNDKNINYDLPILLVDDDNFYRRLIRTSLSGLGFRKIGEAESGTNAIDFLKHHKCELLIIDVQMPGITGIELLQMIRTGETDARRDIPVIILTSFSETEVLQKSIQLDVNGFMIKPTSPEIMLKKLHSAFTVPFQLKSVQEYASVTTKVTNTLSNNKQETHTEKEDTISHAPQDEDKKIKDVPGCSLYELKKLITGMVIGSDVFAIDGTLLLKANTVLTENNIIRLQELIEVLQEKGIWIIDRT